MDIYTGTEAAGTKYKRWIVDTYYGYARTRTPGFLLYSLLTAPLGIASFLWRKLRAPKQPETETDQDSDESAP